MGKYQARVAVDVILRGSTSASAWADRRVVPSVVFTDPQIASVGLTEHAAREQGIDVRVVEHGTGDVAGAHACAASASKGTSRLVVDDARRVVVGATFTGPGVAEMLHAATIAIVGRGAARRAVARGARLPDHERGVAPPPRGLRPLTDPGFGVRNRVVRGGLTPEQWASVVVVSRAMTPITETPEWAALAAHFDTMRDVHLRDLFADDPTRGERSPSTPTGVYFDYSKHRVTAETIRLLVAVAERAGLRERIDAMFRGDKINVTEDRAVLHVALRAPEDAVDRGRRRERRPGRARGAAQDGRLLGAGPLRRVDRPHRQARAQRRQHRHRRLRPRPAHGVRSRWPTSAAAT